MPKIIAVVPMRHTSERVPGKNYRPLAGRPLFHHIISTLLRVPLIDQVVIDTDSELIIGDTAVSFPEVTALRRPPHLTDGSIPMNEVLLNVIDQVPCDLIIQTHSTNPFLTERTIDLALHRFLDGGDGIDSVFGVTRLQARLWSAEGQPINHDPAVLLRTQDLAPLFIENSCFYVFTPGQLRETGNRLGRRPAMLEVAALEAVDIDEETDFTLASVLAERVVSA